METDNNFYQYVQAKVRDNELITVVMSARVTFYMFHFSGGKNYYDGELYFKEDDDDEIRATFLNMGDGEESERTVIKIFKLMTRVSDRRILQPLMFAFCKQKPMEDNKKCVAGMVQGWWSLCFDRFDMTLSEWMAKVANKEITDADKVNLSVGNACLCQFWRDTIREFLELISQIHGCGLYHGSFNEPNNYVFVGDQLKLIKIGGHLDSLSEVDQGSRKITDFKNFRDLLKTMLRSGCQWRERDNFFNCFDINREFSYTLYVQKLVCHPFLKTPVGRMRHLRDIDHDLNQHTRNILNSNRELGVYINWDSSLDSFEEFLPRIYHSPLSKDYDGSLPSELIRFLCNVYKHYKSHDRRKNDDDVEAIIRRRWPGFFGSSSYQDLDWSSQFGRYGLVYEACSL